MTDQPTSSGGGGRRRLDALGPREVVYCHQCSTEWYRDDHGLTCPACQGEITEIVTPESDPRPIVNPNPPTPNYSTRPDPFRDINEHNPWEDDSDPEEQDIEEHVTRGPGGSVLISRTFRSSRPGNLHGRRPPQQGDPNETVRNFQQMLGTLMGPGFRPGQPGTSGSETLFTPTSIVGGSFGNGNRAGGGEQQGPRVSGRFTYTTGTLRARGGEGAQHQAAPVDDLASFIASIFGPQPPPEGPGNGGGMPTGFQGLLAALLNPANARSGDAVYTQEALDQIISNLMDQHPSSNAPGPASPDAIAALPKKTLDQKLLGPEGTGECSVCMDDVYVGTEVVVLPCSHWFHEACATAWLNEHNTCPICRKGIEGETPSSNSRRANQSASSSFPFPSSARFERNQRLSTPRPGHAGRGTGRTMSGEQREDSTARNQARLDAIRSAAGLGPNGEAPRTRQWHAVGSRDMPRGFILSYSPVGPPTGNTENAGSSANRNRTTSGNSLSPLRRLRSSNADNMSSRDGRSENTNGSRRSVQSGEGSRSTAGGSSGRRSSSSQSMASWLRDRWSSNSSNRRHD